MSATTDTKPGETVDYLGYHIAVTCERGPKAPRSPFVIRVLAAVSPWGMQEDLWRWDVYRSEGVVQSGEEFSSLAAIEQAKHWIRLETTGDE